MRSEVIWGKPEGLGCQYGEHLGVRVVWKVEGGAQLLQVGFWCGGGWVGQPRQGRGRVLVLLLLLLLLLRRGRGQGRLQCGR